MENKSKKSLIYMLMLSVLLITVVGATYAFFNYSRTGPGSNLQTGRINFYSSHENTIELTNSFPISRIAALNDTANTELLEIAIIADTNYDSGMEYMITSTDVSNTIAGQQIPINLLIESEDLGNQYDIVDIYTTSYWDMRGGNNAVIGISGYNSAVSKGITALTQNNQKLIVGYVPKGAAGVDGNIRIKAYLDDGSIAISDTFDNDYNREEKGDEYQTSNDWAMNRIIISTEDWNNLSVGDISFKVKIESREGLWVTEPDGYEPSFLVTAKLENIDYNGRFHEGYVTTDEFSFPTRDGYVVMFYDNLTDVNSFTWYISDNTTLLARFVETFTVGMTVDGTRYEAIIPDKNIITESDAYDLFGVPKRDGFHLESASFGYPISGATEITATYVEN